MKTKTKIQLQLDLFKQKYEGIDPAILGITAAVQRGYLYGDNANHKQIRQYWAGLMKKYGKKYSIKTSPKDLRELFIKDIADLKKQMNNQFPNSFANSKPDYDNEFRLAHAQKSLSIYLKHLWSRNQLGGNIPPVCPIDGIILKSIGISDPWTRINSFDDITLKNSTIHGYNYYLSKVDIAANAMGDPLAVWELFQWPSKKNGNKGSVEKRKKKEHRTSSTDPVRPILAGETVLDRTHPASYGYKLNKGATDLYVFAAEDSRKTYCEVISSDGNYTEDMRRTILAHHGFEFKTPRTDRHYFICQFRLGDVDAARRLVEELTAELQ
ncbi:MAG: hypothetical protein IKZ51_06805 [Bacteroidales bacterium]|nr:hypothetical protein [Bacteroidales bacterium]